MPARLTTEELAAQSARRTAARAKLTTGTDQLDLDDVKALSPSDVASALSAGQLRDLGFAAPRNRRGH